MERDTGVAPVTSPWQGDELLLHQTRNKQQAQLTVQNMLLLQQGNTQSLLLEHPPDSATGYTAWKAIILLLNYGCL